MAERLLTVATFPDSVTANLAKNRLESAGVKCALANQETVGMAWHLGNAFGGIQLQVLESDADDATAILGDNVSDEPVPSDEPDLDSPQDDEESTAETEPTTREQNADRAARAAILGILLQPLQLYVLWLLLKVLLSKDRLEAVHRRHAILAAAINLPIIFGCCGIILLLSLGSPDPIASDESSRPESKAQARISFDLGESAFQRGHYASALEHFSNAINLDPDFSAAYVARGRVYALRAEYDSAIAEYSIAIELAPRQPIAYSERAKAYSEIGDIVSAERDENKAHSLTGRSSRDEQ